MKEHKAADIDLENEIVGGLLKHIRSDGEALDILHPSLMHVWVCHIESLQTKEFIQLMSETVTPNDISLTHLKRIKKAGEGLNHLICLLCSTDYLKSESEVTQFVTLKIVPCRDLGPEIIEVPKYLPKTKQLALEWSLNFWPMSWKGNANHQFMMTVQFDLEVEKNMIQYLVEQFKDAPVTIIADPKVKVDGRYQVMAMARDSKDQHILGHSVINAIGSIANQELDRRSEVEDTNYLCHNLIVYTTHEPCVMCSMALVHSRIGRLIYLKSVPESGSLESKYCIGDISSLNWKFEIWKWIGQDVEQITGTHNAYIA